MMQGEEEFLQSKVFVQLFSKSWPPEAEGSSSAHIGFQDGF